MGIYMFFRIHILMVVQCVNDLLLLCFYLFLVPYEVCILSYTEVNTV